MANPRQKPDLPERRVQLRLPAELYDAVFAVADEDMRTLNATVVVLLREALAARGVNVPSKPPARAKRARAT